MDKLTSDRRALSAQLSVLNDFEPISLLIIVRS